MEAPKIQKRVLFTKLRTLLGKENFEHFLVHLSLHKIVNIYIGIGLTCLFLGGAREMKTVLN